MGARIAPSKAFFDTNVLLYLLSADSEKAIRAEALLANGGVVSIQVLNEFGSVASRKLRMTIPEIQECIDPILRVVFNKASSPTRVVTAYFDRTLKR